MSLTQNYRQFWRSNPGVTFDTFNGGYDQLPELDGHALLADHAAYLAAVESKPRGHILTGPVAVKGASLGKVLEVGIEPVELRQDWAWNRIVPLLGTLLEDFPNLCKRLIPIEVERRVALLPRKAFDGW